MAEKIQMWDDLKKSALEHQCHPRPGTLPARVSKPPAERDLARCGRQPRGRFVDSGFEAKLNLPVMPGRAAACVAFNPLEVPGQGRSVARRPPGPAGPRRLANPSIATRGFTRPVGRAPAPSGPGRG